MPRFYYLKRPRTISDFLLFPCLFHFSRYKSLIGGEQYEPDEENPMIGFRGCGRYTDPFFEECFAMELEVRRWLKQFTWRSWCGMALTKSQS